MKFWRKPTIMEVVLMFMALTMLLNTYTVNKRLDSIKINVRIIERIDTLEEYNRGQIEFNQHILNHLTSQAEEASW